jgi:WD40 repeat protein
VRNDVLLWDTGRRAIDRRIEFTGQVSGCAFSPDGRTLALAVDDRLVLVPLGGPPSSGPPPPVGDVPVQQVQFAPNGLLATVAERQPVRLWSVADPRRPRVRGTVGATVSQPNAGDQPLLAFSRDSRLLVFGETVGVPVRSVGSRRTAGPWSWRP